MWQAGDGASLMALEALMTEFFGASTSNDRKRQIEGLLEQFSQTQDCWKHCLYYLANSKNEYVMMYCITVLENLINRQWIGFPSEVKREIRDLVNQFLLDHHDKVPSYIRNKLVKLVVDIGRIDWPHFYPEFFTSILQLAQQSETTALGVILMQTASEELAVPREDLAMSRKEELNKLLLQQIPTVLGLLNTSSFGVSKSQQSETTALGVVLLQTASEELAVPREDLAMSRKEELNKLLLQQIPTVLGLLNSILEMALEKHRHLVSATPPPSPTHGESPMRKNTALLFTSSPLKSDSFMSNIFKSPGSHGLKEALPPLDTGSQYLCSLTLNCLAHYFSWVPLSSTITPTLLSTIFHFAGFGCENNAGRNMNSETNFSSSTHHLGILAMNCINELLSKNCVPIEFEDYLLQMFQQTFYLLQKLTKDSSTCSSGNRLTELDENYVEKFTDFLRLFVSIHLRRFESNAQFPVLEFLALLFKYTFRQPTNDGFYNCLDIWTTFLDFLLTKSKGRESELNAVVNRYKEALISLVCHVLQKLQFKFSQTQLEELDDETLDCDEETEWQHFLRQCLELIAKVSELITVETFQIVYEPLREVIEVYFGLEQYVSTNAPNRCLNIRTENLCRRLHCSLRDLSSLLQCIGRLADHFIGEKFSMRLTDGQSLIERLINMVVYGSKIRLFEVTSTEQNVLQTDFIEVHAQALAAIKPYTHWLAQFYSECQGYPEQCEKLTSLVTTLLESTTLLFDKQVPEKIAHSGAHLMLSIVTTIRPHYYMKVPCIQAMYTTASQGGYRQLSTEVQTLLYRSLNLHLLLPWNAVSDQDWTNRMSLHQSFCHQMTAQYFQLKDTSSLINNKSAQDLARPVIGTTLKLMIDWVNCISGEVVKSKQLCFQSISEVVSITLGLFSVFIHQPDVVEDMMVFFLSLFKSLKIQMGVSFTEQAIQTFMGLFSKKQLEENILQENSAAHRVIEKFLKILQIIVQEPGSAFKRFLPSIIDICMEHIYPILAQRPSPDMKQALYELLHELLINNWRYFFKGSVLNTFNNKEETVENQQQFTLLMQSYGQSFLQPDIAVFRQNLESLEMLNTKWKLYKKAIFHEVMLFQFLNVLCQVLVHKSHDLLQEEIVVTVYNMASVDFDKFYTEFLPQFLTSCEGIDDSQKNMLGQNFKVEKDLPTFTQNLQRFVNDLRYYRQVNNSLPAGSVQFKC